MLSSSLHCFKTIVCPWWQQFRQCSQTINYENGMNGCTYLHDEHWVCIQNTPCIRHYMLVTSSFQFIMGETFTQEYNAQYYDLIIREQHIQAAIRAHPLMLPTQPGLFSSYHSLFYMHAQAQTQTQTQTQTKHVKEKKKTQTHVTVTTKIHKKKVSKKKQAVIVRSKKTIVPQRTLLRVQVSPFLELPMIDIGIIKEEILIKPSCNNSDKSQAQGLSDAIIKGKQTKPKHAEEQQQFRLAIRNKEKTDQSKRVKRKQQRKLKKKLPIDDDDVSTDTTSETTELSTITNKTANLVTMLMLLNMSKFKKSNMNEYANNNNGNNDDNDRVFTNP